MSTILDVASKAGVSSMTVSRYFNHPDLLSEATRDRVRAAVEELQYVPNHAARSLVRGKTRMLALIVGDIINPFFTYFAQGVEHTAQEAGYTLMLASTDERTEKERRYLDVVISRRLDGVLLASAYDHAQQIKRLKQHKIPTVLIDRKVPGAEMDTLTVDSYDGSHQLMRHLVEQGYRKIGFIGGQPGVQSLEERLAGYRDAAREAGLTPCIHLGRYTQQSGEQIVEEMVAQQKLPEALIAANNLVAVGALTALRRHGLCVPEDVALACYGDLELASLIEPFLTVVTHVPYDMGQRAMKMLLERIEGYGGPSRNEVLPIELIVRRSTQASSDS